MWEWRRSRKVVFSDCARMRARPYGPAQSSTLHYSARSGPTKEAHRRALNRPDGPQRMEDGAERSSCVSCIAGRCLGARTSQGWPRPSLSRCRWPSRTTWAMGCTRHHQGHEAPNADSLTIVTAAVSRTLPMVSRRLVLLRSACCAARPPGRWPSETREGLTAAGGRRVRVSIGPETAEGVLVG
jgi:hypothetical protein